VRGILRRHLASLLNIASSLSFGDISQPLQLVLCNPLLLLLGHGLERIKVGVGALLDGDAPVLLLLRLVLLVAELGHPLLHNVVPHHPLFLLLLLNAWANV